MFLLNKLAMLVYTTGTAQKYMTGCHTSTALSQGYVAQTKNQSEHPRVAFSTTGLSTDRSGISP